VQPDHPERHDLWGPIVIARDSALTENICVGVSDCARPEIWSNIFICGREEEKKRRKRKKGRDREGNGAQIIMDPEIEKSETSRCEVHERAGTYLRIHTCICTSESGGPPARDVLFRFATLGDYRLTITSVSGIPVSPSFITIYRSPTDYA